MDEETGDKRLEDFPKIMRVHALGSQGSNPGRLVFCNHHMLHRLSYDTFVIENVRTKENTKKKITPPVTLPSQRQPLLLLPVLLCS